MKIPQFDYSRERGIVWVCDIAQSASYLNSDTSADAFELFLPRLHAAGQLAVQTAGGQLFKWAGDGFLAWFPTKLERELPQQATKVFNATWYLTTLVNISRLGCPEVKPKFRLRHGISYEPDALLYRTPESVELLGRGVTIAFRLASVSADFPYYVAQTKVFDAAKRAGTFQLHGERWHPNDDEILKHFKGEKYGTDELVKASDQRPDQVRLDEAVNATTNIIQRIENGPYERGFSEGFFNALKEGPEWAQNAAAEYAQWAQNTYELLQRFVSGADSGKS